MPASARPATSPTVPSSRAVERSGASCGQGRPRTGRSTARDSSQARATDPTSTTAPSTAPARSRPEAASHSTSTGQCTRYIGYAMPPPATSGRVDSSRSTPRRVGTAPARTTAAALHSGHSAAQPGERPCHVEHEPAGEQPRQAEPAQRHRHRPRHPHPGHDQREEAAEGELPQPGAAVEVRERLAGGGGVHRVRERDQCHRREPHPEGAAQRDARRPGREGRQQHQQHRPDAGRPGPAARATTCAAGGWPTPCRRRSSRPHAGRAPSSRRRSSNRWRRRAARATGSRGSSSSPASTVPATTTAAVGTSRWKTRSHCRGRSTCSPRSIRRTRPPVRKKADRKRNTSTPPETRPSHTW